MVMRNGYIAEDGTMFDDLSHCVHYEHTMGISEYDKIFGKSVEKTAKEVISFFHSSTVLLRKGEDSDYNDIIRRARVHDSLCDGVGLVVGKGDIFFLRDDGVMRRKWTGVLFMNKPCPLFKRLLVKKG